MARNNIRTFLIEIGVDKTNSEVYVIAQKETNLHNNPHYIFMSAK